MRQETSSLIVQLETGALLPSEAPDKIHNAYRLAATAAEGELPNIHGLAGEPRYTGRRGKMETKVIQSSARQAGKPRKPRQPTM